MKHVLTSIALIAAASLGTAASAEPFNGGYVGAQAGWSQHDVAAPATPLGDQSIDRSRDAVSGGAFAGYDLRLGSRGVIGVEAGLQFGIDDRVVRDTGTALVSIDPKRSIDLTARAGYLVSDDTLLYARGGYTNARMRSAIQDASGFRSASRDRDGWLVGGGLEHALSDHVSARAEYRYSDLGGSRGGFDRHQALFGIAYRF